MSSAGVSFVQAEQVVGRVVGVGLDGHHRQAAVQRGLAQLEDARVRREVAAQQQSGELLAIERGQAGGEDDVVAVARGHHQHAGAQQLHGVGHGAGAEHDLVHAALVGLAGVEHLGAEQFGDVTGAQGVEFLGERDGAEQLEVGAAQQRQVLLEAVDESRQAFLGLDLVEDHAEHLGILGAAVQLGLNLDALGQTLEAVAALGRDEDDLGVQALGELGVDALGVVGLAGRHHAFDDDHVLAHSDLLEAADHVLEQQVDLAIGELALHLFQRQRFGRGQVQRALDEDAGALAALVDREGLGDRRRNRPSARRFPARGSGRG